MASMSLSSCICRRSMATVCRTNGAPVWRIRPLVATRGFVSGTPPSRPTQRATARLTRHPARSYLSSAQGTISEGAAGIPSEVALSSEAITAPEHLSEKERQIWELLQKELSPAKLEVQDISGGCGSMYGIEVLSERFRGLSLLKQQRLVNGVLKEEIGGWHGVQLKTGVP